MNDARDQTQGSISLPLLSALASHPDFQEGVHEGEQHFQQYPFETRDLSTENKILPAVAERLSYSTYQAGGGTLWPANLPKAHGIRQMGFLVGFYDQAYFGEGASKYTQGKEVCTRMDQRHGWTTIPLLAVLAGNPSFLRGLREGVKTFTLQLHQIERSRLLAELGADEILPAITEKLSYSIYQGTVGEHQPMCFISATCLHNLGHKVGFYDRVYLAEAASRNARKQTQSVPELPTPLCAETDMPSRLQDLHLVCDTALVETLVAEFVYANSAYVYDWGYSMRYGNGYIVLSGEAFALLQLEQRMQVDPRIEGSQLYDLPDDLTCTGVICEQEKAGAQHT